MLIRVRAWSCPVCTGLRRGLRVAEPADRVQPRRLRPSRRPRPPAPPPLPGESTITGSIKFEGTAEKPRVVRMDSDPLCMPEGPDTSEVLLVGPGNGLQNAFVYVKDGLGDRTFQAPKTPVVLDQKGCKYLPHVFGAQVGQPVIILNSDPTLHNVHAVPKANAEFNFGQAVKGMKTTRHVRQAGSHGAVPLRRPRLDGGLRRRRFAPVLRRHQAPTAASKSRDCRPAPTRSRSGTNGSARARRPSRLTARRERPRTSRSRASVSAVLRSWSFGPGPFLGSWSVLWSP